MSIIRCTKCDRPFDTDIEVEATFLPLPVCEQCSYDEQEKLEEKEKLEEQNKEFQAWALAIDADDNYINSQIGD